MADRPPAPAGLHLVAAAGLRVEEDGCVLVGGSPLRLVRLSAAGARIVRDWFDGAAVGESEAERRLARRMLDAGIAHPRPAEVPAGEVVVVLPALDEPEITEIAAELADGRPVIVVDDGSDPPIPTHDDRVEIVRRSSPGGPGVARNDGLRRATDRGAEFVAFVDADVDAPPGWVDRLLAHFGDPDVVAVAPRVRPNIGTAVLERYEATFPSLDLGDQPAMVGPGRAVAYVPSAALVVRASAFAAAGGFDPALRFGEDVDLVWRLVDAGHTVRYDPAVEVRHRARANWRAWLAQRRDYGSSAAVLAQRHGQAVAPSRAPVGVYAAIASAAVAPVPVAVGVAAAEGVAAHRRVAASLGAHHDPALVRGGLLAAARSTVLAFLRAWLPVTAAVAFTGRRPRRRLAALLTAAVVAEVAQSPRHLGWIRTAAVRAVDHSAYGVGVWTGILRVGRRGLAAISPVLSRPGVRAEPTATDTVDA